MIQALILLALGATNVNALSTKKRATTPQVANVEYQGVASDVYLNRDSCTSALVDYRSLWTCRDTMASNGDFYVSSASWSNFSNSQPEVIFGVLSLYGNQYGSYFPVQDDECGSGNGFCSDGTRWAIWPDTRVLPVQGSGGDVNLYTWIRNTKIGPGLQNDIPQPTCSLYKGYYSLSMGVNSNIPPTSIVTETFWPSGAVPYGNYGWALSADGNTAYLYGQLIKSDGSTDGVGVAQVPINSIEDKSQYQYWTGSSWSNTAPGGDDTSAVIAGFGNNGQGTFYYSSYFSQYIWLGAGYIGDNAAFLLSYATEPQGPWSEPTQVFNGPVGNNSNGLVAYSQQAHPDLSSGLGGGNDIWLSYTKLDESPNGDVIYSTPLYKLTWQ